MKYWETRSEALGHLESRLPHLKKLVDKAFTTLDNLIDVYNGAMASRPEQHFEYIVMCGCTLAKGKNLALAVFSLILDGLAQEAGAVGRPLMECCEKLEFLSKDPTRAIAFSQGKVLKHGKIAQQIENPQKGLRDYFSNHASHISYSFYAMQHLIDWRDEAGLLRKFQPLVEDVLERNLWTLIAVTTRLGIQAGSCLYEIGIPTQEIAQELEGLRVALLEEADAREQAA